jgi:S1-C subfamily serine protease
VVKLENKEINNTSELQEMVSRYRPGDKVKVGILRQGLPKEITVQLQSGKVK